MAKTKSKKIFVCQSCGAETVKWAGQCPSCHTWGSIVEEVVDRRQPKLSSPGQATDWAGRSQPTLLQDIHTQTEARVLTPDLEMNRVLGGGMVPGAAMLIGGEPGIGKSTLLLQVALQLSPKKVLYCSGEESATQIRMRAERIPFQNDQLYVAAEPNLDRILDFIQKYQPQLVIIDSIQTLYSDALDSAPGSVSQIRECAARVIRAAKELSIPIFLVGHITKEGSLAGPKVLEHMVDTVLTFEGDQHHSYRLVRTSKNRFGSTMEIGIYEMLSTGLREVSNPSEIFLSSGEEDFSGVSIAATMEGMRPLLIETQALVSPMAFGTAQRSATGFDLRRLNMLLAVLEKRCGFKLGVQDVFVNITGGMKVEDPAVDLGLVCAIISSLHDLVVPRSTAFAAEVGLSGEIRAVTRLEPRIAEAEKLGFERIFVAQSQATGLSRQFKHIDIQGVSRLDTVFRQVFGG